MWKTLTEGHINFFVIISVLNMTGYHFGSTVHLLNYSSMLVILKDRVLETILICPALAWKSENPADDGDRLSELLYADQLALIRSVRSAGCCCCCAAAAVRQVDNDLADDALLR